MEASCSDKHGLSRALAERITRLKAEDIPPEIATIAKQCLLDWSGVALSARNAPLVVLLLNELQASDNAGCSVVGRRERLSRLHTALVNGTMGHALDYDDVLVPMGHPTVPIAPALLALAEHLESSGITLLAAFVAGVEIECRIAAAAGPSHYASGWHGTATFGTFGAAAACGHLMGLDADRMVQALNLAATQAAGLKAVFGSMAKPLHAGKAAMNGLLAARLAASGFTAGEDALSGAQGFGATQSMAFEAERALIDPPEGFYLRRALFKYHAACYLTHSAIEAAAALSRRVSPADLCGIEIVVDPGHLSVCAIAAPRTGLECKFSLAMVVSMALAGEDTADDALFTDAIAGRPDLVALRQRVVLVTRKRESVTMSDVIVTSHDGRRHIASADVAIPATDVDDQWRPVAAKFRTLAGNAIGAEQARMLEDSVRNLELIPATELIRLLRHDTGSVRADAFDTARELTSHSNASFTVRNASTIN